jgi:hypothetical protein
MARTLFERVIGDRIGSAPRNGGHRHRSAREIDIDVTRTRHHIESQPTITHRRHAS